MVQIDTTKISSKGQIVIPSSMRNDFKEGDTLLILKDKNTILLKKAGDLDEKFKEDFEFARRTGEAFKRIEAGEYISLDSENIFEEMKKW